MAVPKGQVQAGGSGLDLEMEDDRARRGAMS